MRRSGAVGECLGDALRVLGPGPLVGLCSTPTRWEVLSLSAETTLPAECFELHAFCPAGQLTWRRAVGSEIGAALLLLTDGVTAPTEGWSAGRLPDDHVVLPHRHLLWGEAVALRPGWTAMHEARIEGFEVPFDADGHERLVLEAEEIVGFDDDGNPRVLYERLLGFAPVARAPRREGDDHA